MRQEQATVRSHRVMTGGYHHLVLQAPGIAPAVRPGQFVHLLVPRLRGAVLRRPFSVFKTHADGSLEILYKAVGQGTRVLRDAVPGDVVDLLGPLGNGFPAPQADRVPLLVAGGYGMAALYLLARACPRPSTVFVGGRSAGDVLCVEDFEALGWNVVVATEDGSRGVRGLVTAPLIDALDGTPRAPAADLFACGPMPMLRAVGALAQERNLTAWLSMDRNMGCGIGACLACVQRVVDDEGNAQWKRVCKDGPVFDSRRILWDDREEAP